MTTTPLRTYGPAPLTDDEKDAAQALGKIMTRAALRSVQMYGPTSAHYSALERVIRSAITGSWREVS